MSALERTVLAIVTACVVAALGWGASSLVDMRGAVAVLQSEVATLRASNATVPERIATLEAKVDALPRVLREVLDEHDRARRDRR